jgi:hypothetical protein
MDKLKDQQQQQQPDSLQDPPTEATHGSSGGTDGRHNEHRSGGDSGSSPSPPPNTHMSPTRTFVHASHVSPTSIEVANMRFNETAPPVMSPTSSSPRPAAAAKWRSPPAASSSSPTTSGALARGDHVLKRGRQIPYSTTNDVAEARQYASQRSSALKVDQEGAVPHSRNHHDDMQPRRRRLTQRESKEQERGKRSSSRRHSSPASSPHTRQARRVAHSREAGRHGHQAKRKPRELMRRPPAAAPRFGHPFASNPELPALENPSPAASSPTTASGQWERPQLATAAPNDSRSVPSREAAVPGFALGLVNRTFGELAGAPRPSTHHDNEVVVGLGAFGKGSGASADAAKGRPRVSTMNLASTSLESTQDRHVRVPGRGREDPSASSCSNSNNSGPARLAEKRKTSSGRTGKTTHHPQSHHHHRHHHPANLNTEREKCSNLSHSPTDESDESAATHVTRDSFGYPVYHPIFRHGELGGYDDLDRGRSGGARASLVGGGGAPPAPALDVPTTTDVPWDLRNIADKEINKTFAFLSTRYFWFLVEYALRVTCIAMMIPAIIINLNITYTPFVSTTFALTSVVIAVGTNFGQSCVFFVQYVKGGCIWLPLATICSALKLNHYLAAWFIVYVVLLFLMAMFTEKTTRRMCLLLYNISMVSLLSGNESLVFPTRVLADWALGAAFALVATLIPYPMLATRFSAHITKVMFNNTATCFTGILSCFWAPSNTERSMSMVRIRSLVRTLDHLIEKFDSYDAFTFYEVLIYETSERREVRKEKVKLLLKLKMNLRAMERVINMVQERPQMIDQSERCLLLRDHLSVPMDAISRSMEALLWKLSEAKKYDQLRTLGGYFEATGRAMKRLQTEFDVGRRVLFYEHQEASTLHDGRMEEFVPLMTFFVFSIVNFWTTLEEFESAIDRHKATNDWKESFKLVWNALIDPFVENAELIRLLCVRRAEPEVRVVIEAAKVSVAMLISIIFFYYIDDQSLLLTGPSIIAFVSGTNPVEAVQAGAARMSGTLIGAVLGFFAASLCHNAVDRVASLCVITFVMTFFRPGQKFGTICMYCNFVAVSSLAPTEQTADITISRIQQNTFAIFIYCFISVAVFPVSPNHVLFKKRMSVMRSLNMTLQKLSSLFNDAAHLYIETRNDILRGAKTEDDVVSINRPANTSGNGLNSVTLRDSPFVPAEQGGNIVNNNAMVKVPGLNNSELGGQGNRNNVNALMPGAFTMAPQDTIVEKIFTDIFVMMDTMKATSSVMPLAADEFQIIPHEYPLRASGDVHAALYRLCALVYTMTCAWKTMREKGYFTTDMLHILHNLAPIANDIARCIDRFTHVMEFYVRFPSSGLSSELTKGAMQFRALCVELSARKERDLIAVIRRTIMMKRIRDDDDLAEGEGGSEGSDAGNGNNNNSSSNGSGSDDGSSGGARPPKQRWNVEEWGSRSSQKRRHSRRKRSHEPRYRKGSRLRSKQQQQQRRRRSSHNDVNGLADFACIRDNDCLGHSQIQAAPPPQAVEPAVHDNELSSQVSPRFRMSAVNLEADSIWLPMPRSEVPEMPSGRTQELDIDQYQHNYDVEGDDDSVANTSPRSRADGTGAVTNATRVFDPTLFPPPPLDGEQADAVRRARLEAQLPPSMQSNDVADHVAVLRHTATAPSSVLSPTPFRAEGRDGWEGGKNRSLPSHPPAMSDSSHQLHSTRSSSLNHRHHHSHQPSQYRSSRQPQKLVAHEECPTTKKPSALVRADRLRANIRGFQRQASTNAMSRQHSSFEVRAFGASYTNITSLDKSATIASHNLAHHRPSYPRHHSRHFSPHQRQNGCSHSSLYYDDDEDEDERDSDGEPAKRHSHMQLAHVNDVGRSSDLESSLPYGSREGDLTLLEKSNWRGSTHEPASLSSTDPHTAEGVRRDGPPSNQHTDEGCRAETASLPLPNRKARDNTGTHHHSQDRITLDQSSSEVRSSSSDDKSASSSAYSPSESSASSSGSDDSDRSEYGSSSDSYAENSRSVSSSLVRFNDSFTTPITVQDAEGLHAFTLSLEMFGKELRRVLYGFEEMLQSL